MDILHIEDIEIPLRIERSRGRRIAIKFHSDPIALAVRTPSGKLSHQARNFLQQKEKWILRTYHRLAALDHKREEFWATLRQGKLPYLGEECVIRVYAAPSFQVGSRPGEIRVGMRGKGPTKISLELLNKIMRTLAKQYLIPYTQELAEATDSPVNRIFIKAQKSKWGSCSGKRNINLNWHLIFLPPPLIEYLIIHELMHLREMNHSPAFWKWVKQYYPAYKEAQKALHSYDWVIGILDKAR